MSTFMEILVNGLSRGAVYSLNALGYTMVYGILGMINFAHGDVFMIGMFALGTLGSMGLTALGITIPIAIVIAMLVATGYGWANERIAYRKLRGSHLLTTLTSAIGMSIVLENFIMLSVTKGKIDFPRAAVAPLLAVSWNVGGARITLLQVGLLAVTFVMMAGLFWLIQKTRMGIALRAVSQDRTMASLVGIQVDRTISFTFMLGSALAAVAGTMVGMYQGVLRFDAGYAIGLKYLGKLRSRTRTKPCASPSAATCSPPAPSSRQELAKNCWKATRYARPTWAKRRAFQTKWISRRLPLALAIFSSVRIVGLLFDFSRR